LNDQITVDIRAPQKPDSVYAVPGVLPPGESVVKMTDQGRHTHRPHGPALAATVHLEQRFEFGQFRAEKGASVAKTKKIETVSLYAKEQQVWGIAHIFILNLNPIFFVILKGKKVCT
jgi:hypothetical protein